MTPSAERRHIDDAVYDALGLTAGQRDAAHAGVDELVHNRGCNARNVSRDPTGDAAMLEYISAIDTPTGHAQHHFLQGEMRWTYTNSARPS